jgi:hypothetical protein
MDNNNGIIHTGGWMHFWVWDWNAKDAICLQRHVRYQMLNERKGFVLIGARGAGGIGSGSAYDGGRTCWVCEGGSGQAAKAIQG